MDTFTIQYDILEKINALVLIIDNEGDVEYINEAVISILGHKPNEVTQSDWWNIISFSSKEAELSKRKLIQRFKVQKEGSHNFDYLLKTSTGGKKWIRWNISRLNDVQIIALGYDITEKKLAEERLIETSKNIDIRNKEITDSLLYAKRIQQSILPNISTLQRLCNGAFVFYKPKDIVSGDYYWVYETPTDLYIAAIDCTGHGVPGAMMSMVANSILKEVFINKKLRNTDEILKELDIQLFNSINTNTEDVTKDGMDIALCRIDKSTYTLEFSGAFRPLLIVRDSAIIEVKGSRYPLGFYSNIEKKFDKQSFQLLKDDCIYLFTDGYIDQFGGEKNKKLNRKNFKDLLLSINDMDMEEQEAFLEYAFNNWKQENEQTDDILVIGLRI